jgi:nanoRNase/pAp phosphatase (c-di-AMP/oligoRNAs hydrolase)
MVGPLRSFRHKFCHRFENGDCRSPTRHGVAAAVYPCIFLDRLDFLYDKKSRETVAVTTADKTITANITTTLATTGSTSSDTYNRRIVNNLSANYMLDNKTQIYLFYGTKYVLETIDSTDYSGSLTCPALKDATA